MLIGNLMCFRLHPFYFQEMALTWTRFVSIVSVLELGHMFVALLEYIVDRALRFGSEYKLIVNGLMTTRGTIH